MIYVIILLNPDDIVIIQYNSNQNGLNFGLLRSEADRAEIDLRDPYDNGSIIKSQNRIHPSIIKALMQNLQNCTNDLLIQNFELEKFINNLFASNKFSKRI